MYFPYIRGKQFDLQAICEANNQLYVDNKILPIIEPVNVSRVSLSNYRRLVTNNIPFILIINPREGDLVGNQQQIHTVLINDVLRDYNNYILGYIVDENETIASIRTFINANQNINKAFIHYQNFNNATSLDNLISNARGNNFNIFIDRRVSSAYINSFSMGIRKVLISDGFRRRTRNADYPPDEFFSSLYQTYHPTYFGFGDFLIIGEEYIPGGGPAYCVALHISYINPQNNNDIFVRHFISDDNDTPVDPGNKFSQALIKLIRFRRSNSLILRTNGIAQLISYNNTGEYHGLGDVKRICMIHHLELIGSLI